MSERRTEPTDIGQLSSRLAAIVRFCVAAVVATYAITYSPPAGVTLPRFVTPLALAIACDLFVLALLQGHVKGQAATGMRALFMVADLASPIALLFLYASDPGQQLFILLFVSMAQGALALRMTGTLLAWSLSSAAYVLLQVQVEAQGGASAPPLVVGLRVTIMLVIAIIMARLTSSLEKGAIERDVAEQSLVYQANLLENVTDAVLATDLAMRITSWNHAAEKIYGWAADEVIGRQLFDVLQSKMIGEGTIAFTDQLEESGSWSGEFVQLRRNGEPVNVEAKGIPLRDEDGAISGYVTVNREITDRRSAAEARIRADQSENASRAKDEFLSRMSHELRTPLNAVLGFAQLLSMDELNVEQRREVQEIMVGGKHLLSLINEVLDLSRASVDHLALEIAPTSVGKVVDEAVSLVAAIAESRRIDIQMQVPPADAVLSDDQRLRQVLLNLLSNAIKYNAAGGKIIVRSQCLASGYVRISVCDDGSGIAEEDQETIFQPFERLGADRTEVEGTGLGLPLTQGLVEAMGGRIGVYSVLGEGSTFWFELAACLVPDEDAMSPSIAGAIDIHSLTRALVLHIEDNPGNVRLVESVLERMPNAELITAKDGSTGLALAREAKPNLILLDVHLPDMLGEEVLYHLRRDAATRDIPVVAVSADVGDAQAGRMMSAGAAEYLTKPIDITRLVSIVNGASVGSHQSVA